MRKKFTMIFALLLACVGVMKAQVFSNDNLKEITPGNYYIYYTDANSVKHYLQTIGANSFAIVTENPAYYSISVGGGDAYNKAYYIQMGTGNWCFSNPNPNNNHTLTTGTIGWNATAYISTVVFENSEGLCALRSTNAPITTWDENYFITHTDDHQVTAQEGDEGGEYLFVWTIEKAATDFTTLNNAITAANTVLTDAGYTFAIGDAVALQIDNEGAAGYLSVSHPACDEDVLANVIDKDESGNAKLGTLYHSNWMGATATPYMQVDLGDGQSLQAFVLNYSTRQSGNNGAPYAMTVSGSNNGEDFTTITELNKYDGINAIPAANAKEYTGVFVADEAYRYLRFTVTSSPNGNNSFGMANFAINKATVTGEMTGTKMRYATIYKAILDATAVASDENTTQEEADAAATYLNNLVAIATATCPFVLTTDVEKPVCYLIKSSRANQAWNNPYWTLSGNGVAITEFDSEEAVSKSVDSYWYFMEDKNTGLLTMYPFVAHNVAMGYKAAGDAANKLTNVPTECVGIRYQLVVKDGDYPYALKPYGNNTYVSNYGGKGYLLGFYNDVNDHGTRFNLVEAVAPSLKLRDLKAAISAAQGYEAGTALGEYTEASVAALNTALEAALAVYNDATTATDEKCQEQISALTTAKSNLTVNLPEAGKFYRIMNNGGTGYLSTGTTGRTQFVAGIGEQASSIFYYTGTKLIDYTTGLYLVMDNENMLAYTNAVGEAAGTTIAFAKSPVLGKLLISFDGGNRSFYSDAAGNSNAASAGQTGDSYRFTVSEVEWLPVAINEEVGYATFYSPVELELSQNRVKAYTGKVEGSVLKLAEQEVVPANTGVILELQEGAEVENGYTFLQVKETTLTNLDNDLAGTFAKTYVTDDAYVLAKKNDVVGLYKATKNQQGNTAFLNNAFKAYLPVVSNAPMFSFNRGEGTTGIDKAQLTMDNVVIYDLLGRRVEKMEKGIYIVNGKKIIK